MNARTHTFEMSVEGRQVQETASSILHTLLFHRTLGKFSYKQEESYSVGTIGFEDISCDFVDFTYIRVSSDELINHVQKQVSAFSDSLRSKDGPYSGKLCLEFYQKKRSGRWLYRETPTPWEIWTIQINVITLGNEHERQIYREKVGDMLAEKVFYIANAMNRQEYVPKMPSKSEVHLIFDTTYSDIQPYLFNITYQTSGPTNPSVATSVRKLIKELAF